MKLGGTVSCSFAYHHKGQVWTELNSIELFAIIIPDIRNVKTNQFQLTGSDDIGKVVLLYSLPVKNLPALGQTVVGSVCHAPQQHTTLLQGSFPVP